jgi:polygalacturonase
MKKYLYYSILFVATITGHISFLYGQDKAQETSLKQGAIITVGINGADINGSDNLAIQSAVDMMYQRGGGTVKILAGEYILQDAIRLHSNIHLTGDREKTILKHAPAVSSSLLKDADIGQKEVTPKDPSLFRVGMGIVCRDNELPNEMVNKPLTIIRIENGVLYLNGYIEFDFNADYDLPQKGGKGALIANIFPLLYGFEVENVIIDGLTIDSKVDKNPGWIDVRTGGVCLDRSKNCIVRNITSINSQGDGILVISSEHTTVEDCEAAYNSYHGIHPGSHSPWTIVQRCYIHHNGSDGLYICWGVRESEFTDNVIYYNGIRENTTFPDNGKRHGISIGHKDTDNLIARNHIYENASEGIHFRHKTEANGAHRTTIRENIIENNGLPGHVERGCGISINAITHDIIIDNNIIRETRTGNDRLQKNALQIEQGVSRVQMVNNKISGHPEAAIIDNSKSPDNKLQ